MVGRGGCVFSDVVAANGLLGVGRCGALLSGFPPLPVVHSAFSACLLSHPVRGPIPSYHPTSCFTYLTEHCATGTCHLPSAFPLHTISTIIPR